MRRLVSMWIAAAVVLAFAVAARDARALDDRSAKGCPSCEQGTGGGAVLVADDGDDPMEGIPEKWRKALKERLEKLPVERREAILKRIRSLKPEQRQALLERFMKRSKDAAGEGKKPAKTEKKSATEKRPAERGEHARGEFDRAREMFESYVRKNPDAMKDAGKLFDLARKHFEEMPQAQREQLKRFLQLDPKRRGAVLEHFRALVDPGDHAKDGKKHGKKGGKDHATDGKKHGKKEGKGHEARRGDRGPGGPFFRRLPPQVRERIQKFFQDLPPEARERIKRFHDQMQKHMQERFQGRDGKRGRPGAHEGKRGPGPDQFREALRRHIQEMMKQRHGGEEKKGHKDGKKGEKKGGKKGHKKHHDDIAVM